jgi:hypothetical protein
MADTVATQILFEGDKQVIMKFTNNSDGTGESAVTKVDVSTLAPYQGRPCVDVQIDRIYFLTHGMEVRLLWGATTNLTIMTVPQNIAQTMDFNDFGGLNNNAGAGKTGNILFTTLGVNSGDSYTIILVMRKLY